MNRTIALLIPAILLAAMALIVFQQFHSAQNEPLPVQSVENETDVPADKVEPPVPSMSTTAPLPAEEEQPGSLQAAGDAAEAPSSNIPPKADDSNPPPVSQAQPEDSGDNSRPDEKSAPKQSKTSAGQTEQSQAPVAQPAAAEPAPEPVKSHKAESFKFQYQGNEMLFIITADSGFEYKSFVLTSPDRLIIDLLGNWSGVENVKAPSNRLISGMRNGKTERGHRVVLDLKQAPKGYETKREGNKVTVRVF
ncbi:MAG: AMIN domain-containing protein [Desulfovibrionaceae bacterium]|nr:AMIN domain-containing protein [Desulfovibrionaceae bacterium]